MAGESISSMILFIAAILVAAAVAGTLVTNVNDISSSIESHSLGVTESIDTDVEIISDPGSDAIYDVADGNVTILVKNTGSKTLSTDPGRIDVLIDGRYVDAADKHLAVLTGSSWRADDVAELTIAASLDPGEHRVVVNANGAEEVFEFYVA